VRARLSVFLVEFLENGAETATTQEAVALFLWLPVALEL
jgi:hypothetical protein